MAQTDKCQRYYLVVADDVASGGPFPTDAAREADLRENFKDLDSLDDVFALDLQPDGRLEAWRIDVMTVISGDGELDDAELDADGAGEA